MFQLHNRSIATCLIYQWFYKVWNHLHYIDYICKHVWRCKPYHISLIDDPAFDGLILLGKWKCLPSNGSLIKAFEIILKLIEHYQHYHQMNGYYMAFKVIWLSSIRIVVAYWAFRCNNKKEDIEYKDGKKHLNWIYLRK